MAYEKDGTVTHRWRGCWIAIPVAALALVCGGGIFIAWAQSQTAVEYQIPADYRGWVAITYQSQGCPQLQRRAFTEIIVLDSSGRTCTANGPQLRPHFPHFFLVSSDGSRVEILTGKVGMNGVAVWQAGAHEDLQTQRIVETFFVGTEVQYQQAGARPDR